MPSVYMGPLGSTQLVQGAIAGAGGLVVEFQQNNGPQLFPGDSLEHVLIPPFAVNFTGAGNAALDISVGLFTTIVSLLPISAAVRFFFDGLPAGSMAFVFPEDAVGNIRIVRGSVTFGGPIPPGVHTLELRVISGIDVEISPTIGAFNASCDAQIRVMFAA